MPNSSSRKVVRAAMLARRLAAERRSGRTVAQCHGCFDIVHPGHVRYLKFARSLGDLLVVSLTGDAMVEKGPDRPYIPQELRAENLAALEFVDWVVIDPNPTACELLEILKPDVYVKGREYAASGDPRFQRERAIVEGYGGRVVFHSGDVVFSSTQLIRSLNGESHLDECRLRALCERGRVCESSVRRTVEGFTGAAVVVVGDALRETYVLCDARETASDAPAMSLQKLGERHYWGGAAALALQLHALGARPFLITTTGNGAASAELHRELQRRGVGCESLPAREQMPQRWTHVADDVKLFHVTDGARSALDSVCEQQLISRIGPRLADADLLIWCDHGYGCVTPGLVNAVSAAAHRPRTCVAAMSGPSGAIESLGGTDLIVVTERYLRMAMHDTAANVPSLVWHLLQRIAGRTAIVSLHKNGFLTFDARSQAAVEPVGQARDALPARLRSEFVPALADMYVDLAGVQEAVASIAGLTLAGGGSLALAAYLAAGAEALVAARPGRTLLTTGEMFAWLDRRPELQPESRFLPDPDTEPAKTAAERGVPRTSALLTPRS